MKTAIVVATALLAATLGLARADALRAQPSSLAPGTHRVELRSGGRSRTYLVYVPAQAQSGRALPLVLNFHGGGSNAEQQQEFSQMNRLASREGFVVVYPNGTGVLRDRLLTWNAGSCCGYAEKQRVDDVGFSLAVVRDVSRRLRVDRRRVYATGMSNGGMMAHRLGAEAAGAIAAIAPVAGGLVVEAEQSRPVPVMHFHSVDDPRAPYAGGLGPAYPGTGYRVTHPSIEATIARWVAVDDCRSRPSIGRTRSQGGHTATRLVYGGCRGGAAVVHWKLTGAGHVWPGGKQGVAIGILGDPTRVVDANAEMWRFFELHRLPG